MKTYQVIFKYETYATFEVQAADRDDAENAAYDLLVEDAGDYLHTGEWTDDETPVQFDTYEAAAAELADHLRDLAYAVKHGHMDDFNHSAYRIKKL